VDTSDSELVSSLERRAAYAAQLASQADSLASDGRDNAATYERQGVSLKRQAASLRRQASQVRVRAQQVRRPRPTPRAPRTRRAARRRATARGPDDREPEPPLAVLGAEERRGLRLLIDQARRRHLKRTATWRTCAHCLREQEPAEFSRGAKYCKSCERERVSAYRQRKAVAA